MREGELVIRKWSATTYGAQRSSALVQQTCVSGEGSPSLRAAPDGRANGLEVHPQDAFTRERTGGAPLAAMHKQLTLSVCKRRDAVRLALNEPARPAGAAFGGLSGASSSWPAACGGRRACKPGHYSFVEARSTRIERGR